MSMYSIKIILLFLLLTGCVTGPTGTPVPAPQNAKQDNTQENIPKNNPITLYRTAITDLNNNDLKNAESNFRTITKSEPDLAGPWANLALINIKQENYVEAEKNVRTALERNPEMAQALNIAGFIETRKGNITKAKEYYIQAVVKKPDYALAHYNLALLYDVYLQNIKKAVEHYQLYLSLLGYEDIKTKNWVEELKLNIKSSDT